MQTKSTSWATITVWLIFFFPVAIYLIIKKLSVDKLDYITNGKALRNLGYALVVLAIMFLIMAYTGTLQTVDGSSIVGPLIISEIVVGGCAILCLYKGSNFIKRGTKYNRYISIINTSNDLIIDNIAALVPTTTLQAVKDIDYMLNDGFFPNAYLDFNKGELIMPKSTANISLVTNITTDDNKNSQPPFMKCPNCGAMNKIVQHTKNECEYCGSPL